MFIMLQHLTSLLMSKHGLFVPLTWENNDVGKTRRYARNILQWNKNKTKSTRMTQWRLLASTYKCKESR